ncbi:metal-dependent hydrolase [Cereibacter sp. SYSU M97828]|nr:metal-dependent hydrolase [Cereibacter flavus]
MLIAHLPAGYLLADGLSRGRRDRGALIAAGTVSAILPDLDMFWFHLVNGRQNLHHDFLFHWPLFWVALACPLWLMTRGTARACVAVALASLLLHMALDSVAGHIRWLAPFSDWTLNLIEIPARYDWWVWTFMHHWLFAVEVAIVIWAALRAMKKAPGGAPS